MLLHAVLPFFHSQCILERSPCRYIASSLLLRNSLVDVCIVTLLPLMNHVCASITTGAFLEVTLLDQRR